jgi:phosphate transport system substrate-binding protein
MSEPSPEPPKPFSTVNYLFLTTLWAFVLPGILAHGVVMPAVFKLARSMGEGPIYLLYHWFIGCVAFACVLLFYPSLMLLKRPFANLREGRVQGSFFLWILPFWLPLFWGLAVSAIGFCTAPLSFNNYAFAGKCGFFQYYCFIGALEYVGDVDFFMAIASIINLLLAIEGTVYVSRSVSSVPKVRGLTLLATITLLLCRLVALTYSYFRTEILLTAYFETHKIVREEATPYWSDTNLSEYSPFDENNKLVKVELPTLVIESEHPKIHGAFALYPVYAAAVEATYHHPDEIDIKAHYRIYRSDTVRAGTSPEAFKSLLRDDKWQFDMIFMLQPSEKQLQESADKNIELDITPIGYEAFVFFVSKVNPVDDLSLDQIRNIYSKKTTRWNEVGGKNERILPFQRPEGSGSQTAMLRVMENVPMAPPQKEEFQPGMGKIVADVADYRNYGNAIGFSFRYYVEGLFKHEGVKLLKINGVAPTIENVQNKSYPLIGELVIISRKDNENPNVSKLTDWFLSPQGQELIKNVGYVPLDI